ncbi:MAG: branched-chain amino acid ABC transporter substrate-binding protein [Cycloclasticus sp. symbiont of Poecilosclerida sp. M]|nr:MAG: branched-chain amino acid ABC transporter substrate-binding protein [Cycloclasticus sp. symbiont of Poecilosclerida sp. M]
MIRFFLLLLCFSSAVSLAATKVVNVAYLHEKLPTPPALSNLDPMVLGEGLQGVRLGIEDSNTTGKFTGHHYKMKYVDVAVDSSVQLAFDELVKKGYRYIIANVQAKTLTTLARSAAAKNILIFNVAAQDDALRNKSCSTNVVHITPSDAMRADALAQFMFKKRWKKWFLIKGDSAADEQFSLALKRSAKHFGIKIVEEKTWRFQHDARRTAQAEIPVFTQADDYDAVVVADVAGLFGEYLPLNTWLPRPVVGTQGLVPRAWHRTHERWGAVQLQNRFYEQAGRWMGDVDYASWLAVRAIGESVTRTQKADLASVKMFMLSEQFSLAGFKGTRLSFRRWNQQLRQPVLLATARSLVSVLPHREFLHPRTFLDTLGYDEPESSCQLNTN